jgi:hypothetical protein
MASNLLTRAGERQPRRQWRTGESASWRPDSRKITVDVRGEILAAQGNLNTHGRAASLVCRGSTACAREVGTEACWRPGHRAGVAGTWKDLTNRELRCRNLTTQVRNIAEVTTARGQGDCRARLRSTVKGEILELKNTINTMVDQLNRLRRRSYTRGRATSVRKANSAAGRTSEVWPELGRNSLGHTVTTFKWPGESSPEHGPRAIDPKSCT